MKLFVSNFGMQINHGQHSSLHVMEGGLFRSRDHFFVSAAARIHLLAGYCLN